MSLRIQLAPRIAETSARRLLAEVGVQASPIDLTAITRYLGVAVTTEPLQDNVSGMLLRRDGLAVIAINSSHPDRRRRFTEAHEIGHFMLHKGIYIDRDTRINQRSTRSSSGLDQDEVQANAFAAELLMPMDLLIREFNVQARKQRASATAIVTMLADRFLVSRQAMEIRLSSVGALTPF